MEKKKYVTPEVEVVNMKLDKNVLLGISIDKGEDGPGIAEAPEIVYFDDEVVLDDDNMEE